MGRGDGMLQHPLGGVGWMPERCLQHPVHPKPPALWRAEVVYMHVCAGGGLFVQAYVVLCPKYMVHAPNLGHFWEQQLSYTNCK